MTSTSMTKRQVAELLSFLSDVYPNLNITQSRINTWHALMKEQNPATVMKKAENYVLRNSYPPSVADLSVISFKKSKEQIEHEKMLKENGLL